MHAYVSQTSTITVSYIHNVFSQEITHLVPLCVCGLLCVPAVSVVVLQSLISNDFQCTMQ